MGPAVVFLFGFITRLDSKTWSSLCFQKLCLEISDSINDRPTKSITIKYNQMVVFRCRPVRLFYFCCSSPPILYDISIYLCHKTKPFSFSTISQFCVSFRDFVFPYSFFFWFDLLSIFRSVSGEGVFVCCIRLLSYVYFVLSPPPSPPNSNVNPSPTHHPFDCAAGNCSSAASAGRQQKVSPIFTLPKDLRLTHTDLQRSSACTSASTARSRAST